MLPHELSERMLAAEESAYLLLYQVEPWGDRRLEIMLAQIAQILWNANVSKKQHARKLTDFLPWFKKKQEEPEDVELKLKAALGLPIRK